MKVSFGDRSRAMRRAYAVAGRALPAGRRLADDRRAPAHGIRSDHAATALGPRRLLPVPGVALDSDARGSGVDLPAAPRGVRLRPAGGPGRAADRARAAVPAEGPLRPGQPGAA